MFIVARSYVTEVYRGEESVDEEYLSNVDGKYVKSLKNARQFNSLDLAKEFCGHNCFVYEIEKRSNKLFVIDTIYV